jgi:hypothetical protein
MLCATEGNVNANSKAEIANSLFMNPPNAATTNFDKSSQSPLEF